MGLIEALAGRRTYLDANVFIYAFEGHAVFASPLQALFATGLGGPALVTSELTLAEVLVRPLREGRVDLTTLYHRRLHPQPGLTVAPVARAVLVEAARLRAAFPTLRLPDAIHAATASLHGCGVLLTNDTRLATVPGVAVVLLSEVASG